MSDDPYRMYIVIRRGAFTSLDEGGRKVGLAAEFVLVFFGLTSDSQSIFQGFILLIAVAIDGYRARRLPS